MSKTYSTTEKLSNENLSIYGLQANSLSFRGLNFWHLFYKAIEEKNSDKIFLSPEQRFDYFKCYVISVAKMINKRYREPDNKIGYEFQIDFLYDLSIKIKEYYEEQPHDRFFKEFPMPPHNEEKEKSIENWLIQLSEWRLTDLHNSWYTQVYKKECINYPAYLKEKKKYKKLIKSGLNAEKPILEDFRDQGCWKSSSVATHVVSEFMESTFYYDKNELEHIEEFIIRKTKPSILEESQEVSSLLNKFKLTEEKRMRKLFNRFHPNDIAEIDPSGLWEVNYVMIEPEKIWLIFKAMSLGYGLSAQGKQFLVLQYLTIAIAHLKEEMDFDLKSKTSYSGTAHFSTSQMQLLATVIAQSFIEFNNHYKEHILEKFENRNDFVKNSWEESLYIKLSNVVRSKLNIQLKEYSKAGLEKKSLSKISEVSINYTSLEIQDTFGNFEELRRILTLIQDYFMGNRSINNDKNHLIEGFTNYISEHRIALDSIFTFLNPESQKDNPDYEYLSRGVVSAIANSILSQHTNEDVNLNITLTKDENSLNIDLLSQSAAAFFKELIEKDFNIKRDEVTGAADSIAAKYIKNSNEPFKVPIPSGSEYDSYRTMIEMNGPLNVSMPYSPQGDKPFWDSEQMLDDKIVQLLDQSLTELINQSDIAKAISKHL